MKLTFWPSLAIILLVFNTLFIIKRINSNNKIRDLNAQILESQKHYQEDIEINSWYCMLPNVILGYKFDSGQLLTDLNGEQLELRNICKPNGIWVFRYFDKTCSSCYETFIETIRKHSKNLTDIPFVVWTDFNNTKELKSFVSKTHWNCEVFAVDINYEFTPEELKIPYLLYIDNGGQIANCFVIQKDQPRSLIQFLNLTFLVNEQ